MAVKTAPNLPRFRSIKGRVNDLYANCGDAIRSKPAKTVWSTATIFDEMQFLIAEIKRHSGGVVADDAERYRKIVAFVKRVCSEQSAAIKEGQIVKISAEIFSAMRFLVRSLERILLGIVDDDVAEEMKSERMVDEHVDRIALDLTEGIADTDEPDDEELDRLTRPAPQGLIRQPAKVDADSLRWGDDGGKNDDLPGGTE